MKAASCGDITFKTKAIHKLQIHRLREVRHVFLPTSSCGLLVLNDVSGAETVVHLESCPEYRTNFVVDRI